MKKIILKNKNVLVTGARGFVGSNLMKKLELLGANVYGLSHSSGGKHMIKGNILDYKRLNKIVKDKKISICFHLAGEALVEAGQEKPYDTFMVNTQGTLNILEIGRIHNLERIIIASSSHVYGRNKVPYYEGYPSRPSRPYETSKACTDLIAQSYADTFRLPVLIPRFVNIYGPGDLNLNRLIPHSIRNILLHVAPTMWGGEAMRDYLYIDDAVNAYIALATVPMDKVGKNRIFNFGSMNPISVRELIHRIIHISGETVKIEKIEDKRDAEIKSQYVSAKKAKTLLGWIPEVTLEVGLKKTIAWYREFL